MKNIPVGALIATYFTPTAEVTEGILEKGVVVKLEVIGKSNLAIFEEGMYLNF